MNDFFEFYILGMATISAVCSVIITVVLCMEFLL
jgi:hypothetical protein